MAWLLIGPDNEIVSGPHDDWPEAGEGERAVEVALGCEWSVEKGAFVDKAHWMSRFDWIQLWTPAEMYGVKASADPEMAVHWMMLQMWEGPINIRNPAIIAGVERARACGILTDERAARIRAGLPPEDVQ